MRVLHVLHHSVPYLDGYCIRGKQIVDFQRSIGLDVEVVTSGQHELEVERPPERFVPSEEIDGVTYHRVRFPRLPSPVRRTPFAREAALMTALARAIRRLLRAREYDVIHAHSPVICGLPAERVASAAGVPFVYEVRGFWEDGFVDRWKGGRSSYKYKLSRGLETYVFRRASVVTAISQHMLDDIASRGIPRDKLYKVPNGVDARRFVPVQKDRALIDRFGLQGKAVVGFIGSFYRFEGLTTLLEAMVDVRDRMPNAVLMLVGGGEQEAEIPSIVERLGLQRHVIVPGRVPHKEIAKYYSIMDVLVYPRISNRTTELVTPLKPLEAMAMGLPVIGSDVGGIQELVSDRRWGLLFQAGNAGQLADRIVEILQDADLRHRLAAAAHEYIRTERSWDRLVLQYQAIYDRIRGARAPASSPIAARDSAS
jgi:glycogen(starch) synthase